MEECTKALIIRSPNMGGLKYIIANMNGVITLVVPEKRGLDVPGVPGGEGFNPGRGKKNEAAISAEIDELVKVLIKAGSKRTS